MSRRYQKNIEKQLLDLVNERGNNNKCGECGTGYPTWASYNLGIFLCGRCASVHKRILGPPHNDISKVKSLTLDHWNEDQVRRLGKIGNQKARRKWNSKKVPFPFDGDDDIAVVEQYIRDKYILGKFRDNDDVDPSEFDDRLSSGYDSHLRPSMGLRQGLRLKLRLRSNSAFSVYQIPKLTHRKLTTFEYTQYNAQADKIRGYGYNDRDAVLESLLLSNGNIDKALDILDQDTRINPAKEEIAPSLPSRPRPQAQPQSQPQPQSQSQSQISTTSSATPSTSDWWSGNQPPSANSANLSTMTTGVQQPQIYQYTDPVTGQITYVDSNGQEYLDPNNPQHQQQLMNISNPQLIAQQTNKQNILSLYNNPTGVPQPQQTPQQQFGIQQTGFGPQQTGFLPQQPTQFTAFSPGQQQSVPPPSQQQQQQQSQFTGFGHPQQTGYFGQPQQGYFR